MFKKVDMTNDLKEGIKIGFIAMGLLMFATVLGLTMVLDVIVNLGGSFPFWLFSFKLVVFGFTLYKGLRSYKAHKILLDDNFDELKSLKDK